MKKLLLLSIFAAGCHAQTDLPGPVSAIPTNAGASTPICSWNGAQTKKVCYVAASANGSDHTITATDAGYQFDNSLIFTAPTSVGTMANYVANLFAQNIFNYSANTLSIYNDVNLIAIDTGAAQPIQFYTNNTLRGQFDANGLLVSNMAGSGTRTSCSNSSGYFTETSCTQAINNDSQGISGGVVTLTGSLAAITGLVTLPSAGVWAVFGHAAIYVDQTAVAATMGLSVGGTTQSEFGNVGLITAATVTTLSAADQMWTIAVGASTNIQLVAQKATGAGFAQVIDSKLLAIYLHP